MDTLTSIINQAIYGYSRKNDFNNNSIFDLIQEILEFNNRAVYSDLIYEPNPCTFSTKDFYSLELLRAIRFWHFNFDLFSGKALMPYYADLTGTLSYYEDKIWKIYDRDHQFTCEFRIDSKKDKKYIYVLFFKRPKQLQGNYYEFKNFIINRLKPIFFDFLQYDSIMGRAIYSTNSQIKNTQRGDWRLKEKNWKNNQGNTFKVSGLKFLYLKMGFQLGELVDPSLDPQKDYIVLPNQNI